MGDEGWKAFEAGLDAAPGGDRRIVVSSVPALGPRLSLVEALLDLYPGQQQYEDDLRDQWQSRGHRAEWVRFLSRLEREAVERGGPVTVVSGEIHLATRGEMRLRDGSSLHQLVASGITHPKPPAALGLGLGSCRGSATRRCRAADPAEAPAGPAHGLHGRAQLSRVAPPRRTLDRVLGTGRERAHH